MKQATITQFIDVCNEILKVLINDNELDHVAMELRTPADAGEPLTCEFSMLGTVDETMSKEEEDLVDEQIRSLIIPTFVDREQYTWEGASRLNGQIGWYTFAIEFIVA